MQADQPRTSHRLGRARSLLGSIRPLLTNLALAGLATAFAGALAEGMVRVLSPQQLIMMRPDLWQPTDTLGWSHRANVDILINTGERKVRVVTDSAGFRVAPSSVSGDATEVLLLGDSFMEGLQVEYEESVAGLLEQRLTSSLARRVRVRNAGVSGWDPDQYLLQARSLVTEGRYALVVTGVFVGNDVIGARRDYLPPRPYAVRSRLRLPRSASWEEATDAVLRPLNDFLEVRSHVFVLLRSRLEVLRMRAGLSPLEFPPQFLRSEAAAPRWEITTSLLTAVDSVARTTGSKALFVLIPTSFQVDSADFRRYAAGFQLDVADIDLDQPNQRLARELRDRNSTVLDVLDSFRARFDQGEQLYGRVDPHLSPEGNAFLAQLIATAAVELLTRD